MKIGDELWHPCSIDIIRHVVTGINTFEVVVKGKSVIRQQYVSKAKHDVGACGRIEVILSENNGKLRFVELVDEDNIEYSSGLHDFVEGFYYTNETEAKIVYYEQQESLVRRSMENNKRRYEESVRNYERVKKLTNALKEELKSKL